MMAEVAQRYGPYTCVRRLGAGGMAETFLAVQHGAAGFEQRVCMKFMLGALRDDPGFRQMFLREATIAASLRHANIVGVIDVDEHAGYIVLELVDGTDLRTLVNAAPNRRLPAHIVGLIAVELCKALAYAHGRTRRGLPDGIVHRDISPSNVLVSHNGEVKLTDFGVAKAMRSSNEPSSGGIKGKLCYMSPEQTRGEHLDGRSDLFSLGIMLYELIAGVRPFDGPGDAQTLMRIESGRHRAITEMVPDVPNALAMVIERLLRREPEHRFPNADACIDALSRFAPPITTFRELGALARSARAPVTLSSGEFGGATPSGPRPRDPVVRTLRAHAPQALDAFEPSPGLNGMPITLPDTAAMHLPPLSMPEPQEADAKATPKAPKKRGVSIGAWLALTVSFIAATTVIVAWLLRWGGVLDPVVPPPLAQKPEPAQAAPQPSAADVPTLAAGRADAPSSTPRIEAPLAQPAPGADWLKPDLPDRRAPSAAGEPPPLAAGKTEPAREPAPIEEAKAELRVGTVPLGQVWIDGELIGWAPVAIDLPAGLHTVAGGNTSPEVTRNVRLRAGEKKRLVISLEDDAVPDDEATSRASNR